MTQHDDRYDQEPDQTRSRNVGRQPDYIGYTVKDRGPDQDAIWTRLGAAWAHKDGQGFDVQMEAMPVDGRLTLREFKDRRQENTHDRERDRGPSHGR